MTRKHFFVAAVMFATFYCAVFTVAVMLQDHVTEENLNRIEEGMTKAEVEKIFGAKGELGEFQYWSRPNLVGMVWKGHDGTACVLFENNRVATSEHIPTRGWSHGNESMSSKIRRWLHVR